MASQPMVWRSRSYSNRLRAIPVGWYGEMLGASGRQVADRLSRSARGQFREVALADWFEIILESVC